MTWFDIYMLVMAFPGLFLAFCFNIWYNYNEQNLETEQKVAIVFAGVVFGFLGGIFIPITFLISLMWAASKVIDIIVQQIPRKEQ